MLWVSGMHVNKNYTVMTRALVNFSPWLRICSWLELRGKLCERGTDGKDLHVCVCDPARDCGCMVDGSDAMVAS